MSLWCKKCGHVCSATGHYDPKHDKSHKAEIVSSHTPEGKEFIPIALGYNCLCETKGLSPLKKAMCFDAVRHLMSITKGRESGSEKASTHMALSQIMFEYITGTSHRCNFDAWMKIHDKSQEFTSYLDTAIGFPLDKSDDEFSYDIYLKNLRQLFRSKEERKMKFKIINCRKVEDSKTRDTIIWDEAGVGLSARQWEMSDPMSYDVCGCGNIIRKGEEICEDCERR